jgi:hypothetical protein
MRHYDEMRPYNEKPIRGLYPLFTYQCLAPDEASDTINVTEPKQATKVLSLSKVETVDDIHTHIEK